MQPTFEPTGFQPVVPSVNIARLHANGKSAIIMLISQIGNGDIVQVELNNPISSQKKYTPQIYCGTVAAYLIEMIVGIPELSLKPFPNYKNGSLEKLLIHGPPDNYPCLRGYIAKFSNGKPVKREALKEIKGIYEEWWEKNSNRSLEELRSDWRIGKKPLTGSKFKWE